MNYHLYQVLLESSRKKWDFNIQRLKYAFHILLCLAAIYCFFTSFLDWDILVAELSFVSSTKERTNVVLHSARSLYEFCIMAQINFIIYNYCVLCHQKRFLNWFLCFNIFLCCDRYSVFILVFFSWTDSRQLHGGSLCKHKGFFF